MRNPITPILLLLLAFSIGLAAPDHLAAAPFSPLPLLLQEEEEEGQEADTTDQEAEEPDTTTKYTDVITEDAITSEGLFDTHMIEDKLYYEIPLDMLDREMLLLTRIAKTPDGVGYGGSKVNTSTVRWERNKERIFLRLMSYQNFADDTTAISEAVRNSNFEPILATFDIEVMSEDSTAAVVEVTNLFTERPVAYRVAELPARQQFGVRRLDGDRTYIVRATAYPRNVEVRPGRHLRRHPVPVDGQQHDLHGDAPLDAAAPRRPHGAAPLRRAGRLLQQQPDRLRAGHAARGNPLLRHPLAAGTVGPRRVCAR